jgi:uncharacterized lipoprotein YajG
MRLVLSMLFILTAASLLGACATKHELSYVASDAPRWNVNPDKWDANTNKLVTAPTPGAPMVRR